MTPKEVFEALLKSEDAHTTEALLQSVVDLCHSETEAGVRAMFSMPHIQTDTVYLCRLFGDVPLDKISCYSSM